MEGHRADRDEEDLTDDERLPVRSITALHMVMSQDAKTSERNISWSAKICTQLGYDLAILGVKFFLANFSAPGFCVREKTLKCNLTV